MSPEGLSWLVSAALLLCGLAALVLRRQLLAMLLGLELMVNAANLNFVFFGRERGDPAGWAAAILVIAVAAAEVVVGLSLIIALSRSSEADTESIRELQG
ncbi:MAG: NADH-quinone oxidoreductase subunit NuoK [Elusimicrobia bacterium]|nr:NADH-quinone oxidoreductase subunit NuoK [Elusimicrobiota bacterium]